MASSKESAAPISLEEIFKRNNISFCTMTATLFRNRKSGKHVYLEAGKDFANILLSLLLLPVGTVIHLLSEGTHVKPALGGFLNLHQSVQSFNSTDLQVPKEKLTRPRPAPFGCVCNFYGLNLHAGLEYVGTIQRACSPSQFQNITGLVTKDTRYLVTDNLEIMHLTTSNSVSVFSKMKVLSLADLEGIDITITITQVLQLLQSALTSNTCLNDVFGQMK